MGERDGALPWGEKMGGISVELSSPLGMLREMISLTGAGVLSRGFGLGTENPTPA